MRKKFAHYYPTTKETHSLIWNECIFVFDTNVLLDLYRYSPSTSSELLAILTKVKDRIWLPHQVALEFFRSRPEVIITQEKMFSSALNILDSTIKFAQDEIRKNLTFRSHPSIDKDKFLGDITKRIDELKNNLEAEKKIHTDLSSKDDILDQLSNLFDGRVGDPFSQEALLKLYAEGKTRYVDKIPPGYQDALGKNKKESNEVYGDLLLWYQIIEHAKAMKKPVMLVSNDNKEDWWWQVDEQNLGFRPQLAEEMKAKANVLFYMYNSDRFMHYAQEYLKVQVKEESIKEVRELRENDKQTLLSSMAAQILRDQPSPSILDALRATQGIREQISPSILDALRATQGIREQISPSMLEALRAAQGIREQISPSMLEALRAAQGIREQISPSMLEALRAAQGIREQISPSMLEALRAARGIREQIPPKVLDAVRAAELSKKSPPAGQTSSPTPDQKQSDSKKESSDTTTEKPTK